MKKTIVSTAFLISSLMTSLSANSITDWKYEYLDGDEKTYNVYVFDKNYTTTLAIACTEKDKDPLLIVIPNKPISKSEYNIISFKFDNHNKLRLKAPYKEKAVYISDLSLSDNQDYNNFGLKELFNNMKSRNNMVIGMVDHKGNSFYTDFSLKGSSKALNKLLDNCN